LGQGSEASRAREHWGRGVGQAVGVAGEGSGESIGSTIHLILNKIGEMKDIIRFH